jgi:hypothetical protein
MRRCTPLISAVLLAVTVACGDNYLHTNPYDPVVPVTVVVSGPDTLFSYNELGEYSAQSIPAFPDSAFRFGSADSVAFFPSGRGEFSSMTPPLYPTTRIVRVSALLGQIDTTVGNQNLVDCPPVPPPCASLVCPPVPPCIISATHSLAWRHSGSKDVVLTQRIARLQLRCPTVHACDTLSRGAAWSVWVDGLDALNYAVLALSGSNANPAASSTLPAIATFVLRDTTFAVLTPVGVRVATVLAKASGATWIVATRGSLMDSLRLVVR